MKYTRDILLLIGLALVTWGMIDLHPVIGKLLGGSTLIVIAISQAVKKESEDRQGR